MYIIHTYILTYIHTYTHILHTYIRAYSIHIYIAHIYTWSYIILVYIRTYLNTYTYIHTYIYTDTHTNTHINYEIFPNCLYNYFAFHSSSVIILLCGTSQIFISFILLLWLSTYVYTARPKYNLYIQWFINKQSLAYANLFKSIVKQYVRHAR